MNQCQFLVCAILIVISDFLAPVYLKEQRRRTRRSAYPAIFPSNGGTGVILRFTITFYQTIKIQNLLNLRCL